MNRLIQDLLEVAGMEAGHIAVEPRPEQVEPLLREGCTSLDHVASAKSIAVHCLGAEELPRVRADRDRILQVLGNLIGNAVKFTPEGGRIEVRARMDGGDVCISVSDTGPGIQTADLPRVFDRFWQAQRSREGGAGLGLAISRGIVAAHGGRMWVESEAGTGSTFLFTLPVASDGDGRDAAPPATG
jgi:signal transduction histidine kinase